MLPWFHLDKYLIGKHIDYMKIVAKPYLLDKLCEYLDIEFWSNLILVPEVCVRFQFILELLIVSI